jgi:hypothetical protein
MDEFNLQKIEEKLANVDAKVDQLAHTTAGRLDKINAQLNKVSKDFKSVKWQDITLGEREEPNAT